MHQIVTQTPDLHLLRSPSTPVVNAAGLAHGLEPSSPSSAVIVLPGTTRIVYKCHQEFTMPLRETTTPGIAVNAACQNLTPAYLWIMKRPTAQHLHPPPFLRTVVPI
ncbi:hypothetical protein DPMN_153972 [Dreissena polymorpha]|uniref:Uncharacterized protein n=1 Tax=Dreissena polymorpha TaxID=45954 RepID=A0A9D4FMJ1_DREPO|nr:hypothetical protein DPMN_153972 [Dreissena polymorpha]